MQVLIGPFIIVYFMVAPVLFLKWMELMNRHRPQSRRDRVISRSIVLIATMMWPIALPLTYLELLERVRRQEQLE